MTNEELLTHLGVEFKVARIRKKLTRPQLSKLTGISTDSIGRLENGKHDCHILTYKRLYDALDMDISKLL
jgi:DNA-binding XRE family transcriptional regulator